MAQRKKLPPIRSGELLRDELKRDWGQPERAGAACSLLGRRVLPVTHSPDSPNPPFHNRLHPFPHPPHAASTRTPCHSKDREVPQEVVQVSDLRMPGRNRIDETTARKWDGLAHEKGNRFPCFQ
jgi:hypothetical protein